MCAQAVARGTHVYGLYSQLAHNVMYGHTVQPTTERLRSRRRGSGVRINIFLRDTLYTERFLLLPVPPTRFHHGRTGIARAHSQSK